MLIKLEAISKATEKGLKISEYICLLVVADGATYLFDNEVFTNEYLTLGQKGYMLYSEITDKGEQILADIAGEKKENKKIDFKGMHSRLQAELLKLTGKKQKTLYGTHIFLCGAKDLETKLLSISKKYDLKDWNKIEKLLIRYINSCFKANFEKVQLIEYYISRSGVSKLSADYDSFDEKDEIKQVESNQKFM